jgi:hypothetical protein
MFRFVNSYILLMRIRNERCLAYIATGSPEKGPKIGILNLIVFHKISTFAAMSVTICDDRGSKLLPLKTSTLLLDRVS